MNEEELERKDEQRSAFSKAQGLIENLIIIPPSEESQIEQGIMDGEKGNKSDDIWARVIAFEEGRLSFTELFTSSRNQRTIKQRVKAFHHQNYIHWKRLLTRSALAIMLAFAVLLPMFLHPSTYPLEKTILDVNPLKLLLDSLTDKKSVLIAIEYDTAYADEMDSLVYLYIQPLIERDVPIVLLSTYPMGEMQVERLMRKHPQMAQKGKLLNLGYLPSEMVGLTSFADSPEKYISRLEAGNLDHFSNFGEMPKTLADFSVILVFSADAEKVRLWAEQVIPRTDRAALYFIVNAQAAPMAKVYAAQKVTQAIGAEKDIGVISGMDMYVENIDETTQFWQFLLTDGYQSGLAASILFLLASGMFWFVFGWLRSFKKEKVR